jgi:hypothetical protein
MSPGSNRADPLNPYDLTGERDPFSRLIASDGLRAPRGFETAEDAPAVALHSPSRRRARLHTCVVPPRAVCACLWTPSQRTQLEADDAGTHGAEQRQPSAPRGRVSLDTGGLPRNCSSGVRVTSECLQVFGPTHRLTPWPGASSSGPSGPGRVVPRLLDSGARRPCHASAARRSSGQASAPWP